MYKTIGLLIFLNGVSGLAAETKMDIDDPAGEQVRDQFQDVLSQELTQAAKEKRGINDKILKTWGAEYREFMNQKGGIINSESVNTYFAPYYEKIRKAFAVNLSGTVNKTQRFEFSYRVIGGDEQQFHIRATITLTVSSDRIFTIGRGPFNLVNLQLENPGQLDKLKLLDSTLTRIHLVCMPLADGRIVMFDPFSLTGSEICDEEHKDSIKFKRLLKEQKRTTVPMYLPTLTDETMILRLNQGLLTIKKLDDA